MTLNTKNPRAKQRWTLLVGAVAALTLLIASLAFAVHDLAFQLDGNTKVDPATHIGTGTQAYDWDSFFDAGGAKLALPANFTASAFTPDLQTTTKKGVTSFASADSTTFTSGSKDTLDISGWSCAASNNLLSKDDIMNAYSVAYTDPNTGHQVLYFGMERNGNNGDANVAFWFLQGNLSCSTASGTMPFSGNHHDGDILVVSAFTNGGGVSGINAYRWTGGATGSLNTTPIATGGDCKATTAPTGDNICATTNGGDVTKGEFNGPITTQWQTANTADGLDHKLQPSEFFEGGIDLTGTSLAGKCFNNFVGDTRSSQSLTATLFDYAQGTLGQCTSSTVTTPSAGHNGTVSIGAGASLSETDSATVTASPISTFGGNVTFSLCGPLAATSTSNCSTGGVQIGAVKTVSGSGGTATVGSDTATITKVGRYCWRANYSGDTNTGVPTSSDPSNATSVSECFTVTPLQPTISTSATTSVVLGNPIDDTATLLGTANQPGSGGLGTGGTINPTVAGAAAGGSITFSLYGPSATAACNTPIATRTVTVSGDSTATKLYKASNGTGTGSLTPTAVGTYYWIAVYTPDTSGNTLGVSGACGDPGETTIVTGNASIASAQRWLPNDRITVTGDANLNGTLTVTLYTGNNCGVTSGAAVTGQQYSHTFSNATSPQIFQTSNTTFFVGTNPDGSAGGAVGDYSWLVHYADSGLNSPSDICETSNVAITN